MEKSFFPQAYILKIASRCNLNCKYCYMYNLADQTWKQQPRTMSEKVLQAVAEKVARAGLPVTISFHGGEPMLVGTRYIRRAVQIFEEACAPRGVDIAYTMQTNGTLLDEEWIETLHDLQVSLGVSLDGPLDVNDENRIYLGKKRGSHADVVRALRLLLESEKGRAIFAGVLCVVNTDHDPLRTYRHFLDLGVPVVSFLPMDGTYQFPPAGKKPPYTDTPLADWLIPIFDEWFTHHASDVSISLFEQIMQLLLELESDCVEFLGVYPAKLCVVETDGGLEPSDSLKSVGHGFTKLGLNVLEHEVEELFSKDLVRWMQRGEQRLSPRCQVCRYKHVCGGGMLAHRYSEENGFDNPTIYCADMLKLIGHIERRMSETIHPAVVEKVQSVVQKG